MKSDWNNFVDDRSENSLKYLVALGANLKIEQIDKTTFFLRILSIFSWSCYFENKFVVVKQLESQLGVRLISVVSLLLHSLPLVILFHRVLKYLDW